MHKLISPLWTLLFILITSLALQAQTRIEVSTDPVGGSGGATHYHYLFENERFITPRVEVSFSADGQGQFRFTRKEGDEIVNDLKVSAAVVSQVRALLDELRFLESTEGYQY